MKNAILKNGKTVGYYFNENPDLFALEEDYIVFVLNTIAQGYKNRLEKRHFHFADRFLSMEMALRGWNSDIKPGKKQSFVISSEWDIEKIYQIAQNDFDKDRRFAIDFGAQDEGLKNELLYRYISLLKEEKYMATCCYIMGQLEGFNLWSIEEKKGRVILGAVSEKYKGTGMAVCLYSYTIQWMKENGGDFLLDIVSSSNLQSVNLHILLSALGNGRMKIRECIDCYVRDREYERKGL